jgi:hypothetical protein
MKKVIIVSFISVVILALISCTTGKGRSNMHFYHGAKAPDLYISVENHTSQEIEFKINIKFDQKHLYYLILDGDEPISEGWFPTGVQTEHFMVKMKPKKGFEFLPGKTYRLCIGEESPEYVYVHSSNYRCIVDYEFVLD